MRIRAKLTLRNDAMIAAREQLGLTQRQLGELVGVSQAYIASVEAMDYGSPRLATTDIVAEIADALGLMSEQVMPPELLGSVVPSRHVRVAEIEPSRLIQGLSESMKYLPQPSDAMEAAELQDRVKKVLDTLTYREREIIKLRYGIGDGYAYTQREIGRIFKVTTERIHQVEAKAIRKLQQPLRAAMLDMTNTVASVVPGATTKSEAPVPPKEKKVVIRP
jgi:RNA polymerase sigma factor (sigma-70 family)